MYDKGIITDLAGVLFEDMFADIGWLGEGYKVDKRKLNNVKNRVWVERFSVNPDMTSYEFWDYVFSQSGKKMKRRDIENINSRLLESPRTYRKMQDFFKELREYYPDVRTALLTNNSREWFEHYDKELGLREMFDYVVTSYEEGVRKPDPEITRRTLEKLDCKRVAGLDDQEKNVKSMEQAGVEKPIVFEGEEQAIKELKEFLDE